MNLFFQRTPHFVSIYYVFLTIWGAFLSDHDPDALAQRMIQTCRCIQKGHIRTRAIAGKQAVVRGR